MKSANRACAEGEQRDGLTCETHSTLVRAIGSLKNMLHFITRPERSTHTYFPLPFSQARAAATFGRSPCQRLSPGTAQGAAWCTCRWTASRRQRRGQYRLQSGGAGDGPWRGLVPRRSREPWRRRRAPSPDGPRGHQQGVLPLPAAPLVALRLSPRWLSRWRLHLPSLLSRYNTCYNLHSAGSTLPLRCPSNISLLQQKPMHQFLDPPYA